MQPSWAYTALSDCAGAPLAAKAATGALAWGDTWFRGTTRNPWQPSSGSCGSSAGSAAAVVAGEEELCMCPGEAVRACTKYGADSC